MSNHKPIVRFGLLWLVSLAVLSAQGTLTIGEYRHRAKQGDRIVIDTNLRCRVDPSLDAAASGPISLGDVFVSGEMEEALSGNVTWYRRRGGRCWIYGPATFLWNTGGRESVALAILDRLTKKDVRFEDFRAAEKILVDTFDWTLDGQNAHVSARLRFAILQMLDTAASFEDPFSPAFRSWRQLHGDLLRNAPEPNQSAVTVPPEEYWRLFEANRNEPWADDVAWVASSWGPYSDECGAACALSWVMRRQAQYWTRLPKGAHIQAALESANQDVLTRSRYACESDFDAVPIENIEALKKSLATVTHPARQALLRSLDEIERKCRN